MNYYQCQKCKQRFTGWGALKACQKCGGKLKEIPKEIFYKREKEKKREEIKK